MSQQVIALDITLHGGEQVSQASLSMKGKLRIALALERMGAGVMKTGFSIFSPGDFESVQTVAHQVKNSCVCALVRCVEKDIDVTVESLKVTEVFHVHTFTTTSPIHTATKLRNTSDEVTRCAICTAEHAHNHIDDVGFPCEGAGRTPIAGLTWVVEAAINADATTIDISGTVGYTMLFKFVEIISDLYKCVPNIDKAITSVHTHDDLGLVTGNSLAAVHAGAHWVEGTMNRIGERAGNCPLEEVIVAVKICRNILNARTAISHQEIWCTNQLVSQICNTPIPADKAIIGSGAFAHSPSIHQGGVLKNHEDYKVMTPRSISLNQIQLNLASRLRRAAAKHRMDEMGYKESEYNLDNLYDAFLKLADKRGRVFDYDLEALAFIGRQQEEPEHFRLDYFSVQSGSNGIATAAVKLACGEEVKAETTNDNGLVGVVYQTIDCITEYNVELARYSLTAKGRGKGTLGQMDIVISYDSRRFHGIGLATDIIESSTRVMVHVLDNIWRTTEIKKELQHKTQHNEDNKEAV